MKIKNLKIWALASVAIVALAGCTQDEDYKTAEFTPLVLAEDFLHSADNTPLVITNWENIATAGTAKWKQQIYQGNGYAEFTSYQSGEPSNIGWLVSPAVSMDAAEGEILRFQVSQSYVSNTVSNKLEVLISSDYDGTNFAAATWTPLQANLPTVDANYFVFQDSGEIDLSGYTGNIHVAFKVTGGTANAIDGSYQIDNVRIYHN
ncbi:hypothetical protein [Flavobacterium sp.]|uniref:hypothetical protein n=1 Tax=Flavobacterium sp. TaxID=239 RepID=UPI00263304CA|nr:hypothetical protein [Flavobacterium sp.]